MMKSLLFILIFADFFALCCILVLSLSCQNYFDLAFPKSPPRIFGANQSSTDAVVFYYVTRLFLVCTVVLISIYVANIVGTTTDTVTNVTCAGYGSAQRASTCKLGGVRHAI
ncbi:hypothetical protein [Variovorax defluvii]|uniref:hypothetical protein n=1 Tax=Variovorax defluvii TaxID=913761 RepID=UPI0031EE8AE8